jgi:molecular chaperone GrpE (heat shock protein)
MRKFLKVLGWIFIPYIMIFVFWKRLQKPGRIAGIVYSVVILISAMVNGNSGNNTTKPTPQSTTTVASTTPTTSDTNTVENSKTEAQQKADEEAAAKKKADDAQKKAEQQAATKEQQKAKLDAEIQNAKNGSYQDKMKAMKDYINTDKSDLLAQNPTVQDMGFAGDLFVQTNKNTMKYLNSVGDQIISQQAKSVYWEVEVTLNNAGTNPIEINTDMFTLVTSDGREFSTDAKAEMMLSKSIIMDSLNPGVDETGYLIFDVPSNLSMSDVTLNIRNGLFSNVKLKIS